MSIQDILGGGGGAPGGAPPASIQVGGAPPADPAAGGDTGGSVDDLIQTALDALRKAATAPDADHEDKLAIEKMTTLGQQILTNNQKMQDDAMGGSATRMIRKASGGAQGGAGSSGY